MRDAFGGVFMIRLLLVFIVIYVTFSAISLNYAKAFRIKNKVISFIEENEIINLDDYFTKNNLTKLDNILDNANYTMTCINGNGLIASNNGDSSGYCYRGIVIEEKERTQDIIYYNVYTYASHNLGNMHLILALTGGQVNAGNAVTGAWEIVGEAKVRIRK